MTYFFRQRVYLADGRERICAANPYHDELGRFTTADAAVMFVRPKFGYNASPTQDPKWAGAYPEGKRFAIRRVPNQAGGAAEVPPETSTRDFLANVVTAASPPTSGPGVIAVAQQLAGTGTPVPYGDQVAAASTERAAVQQAGAISRDELHPVYHDVIEPVVKMCDRLKPQLDAIGSDMDKMSPDILKNLLTTMGCKATMLGADDRGINAAFKVTTPEGDTVFVKLNHGDKKGWWGVVGGAIEEERSYAVLREAGLGKVVNPVLRAGEDVTVQPFFDAAGPMGRMEEKHGETLVSDAVRDTDGDLAKLIVAEYLLGDADKHEMNYNYYNGRIFGTDWSRTGVYTPFSSAAGSRLSRTNLTVSKADILDVAERTTASIVKLFGDAECYSAGDYRGQTRTVAATDRLDKLRQALHTLPDKFKYTRLHNHMGW